MTAFDDAFKRATGLDVEVVRGIPVDVRRAELIDRGVIDDTVRLGCLGVVRVDKIGRDFDRDFGVGFVNGVRRYVSYVVKYFKGC